MWKITFACSISEWITLRKLGYLLLSLSSDTVADGPRTGTNVDSKMSATTVVVWLMLVPITPAEKRISDLNVDRNGF